MGGHLENSLVPSPTSAKMAAAREKWVWHISPYFLVLLTQHYQDPGKPIRLLVWRASLAPTSSPQLRVSEKARNRGQEVGASAPD